MNKRVAFFVSSIALAVSVSVTFSASASQALRVAADPVPHSEILAQVQKIDPQNALKVIELTSGVNANELLAHGDVDANYFQHVPYLRDQEKALGKQFVVAATVPVKQLGIYSRKHKSFSEVPEGGTVAVPNNVTNPSRALYLLQSQGLVKLKPGYSDPAKDQATPKYIAENPKKLKIKEVEAAQIPRSLDDVDLAVINGNYALRLERAEHNPYANILVTTPAL